MKIKEKVFQPKLGTKIHWYQVLPYQLGDGGKSFPFAIKILTKNDEVLQEQVVNIPASIMETWTGDEVITNYLLSVIGVELDLDDTIELVLEKLNSGTITYASGDQEENDTILKNYASFLALNIESYKKGSMTLDEFPLMSGYGVTVEYDGETFDLIAFVEELVKLPSEQKQGRLDNCVARITNFLETENSVQNSTDENGIGGGVLGSPK